MRIFGDTFFFIALLHGNDMHHERVRRFASERRDVIVTTRWVLAEVADALCTPSLRNAVAAFLERIEQSTAVVVLDESDELFDQGVRLYRERSDKYWSLTDCISFAAMKREGLTEALTGDRHFEQAGFKALFA